MMWHLPGMAIASG